jgi:hypothetical protein
LEDKDSLILDHGLVISRPRKEHLYSIAFGMTFVTGDNHQCCAFVSCRDYMHDTIRTKVNNNKRVEDDGHSYYPKAGDPDLCMDRLRVMFRFKASCLSKFKMGLKALNDMEVHAGDIERTVGEFVTIKDQKDTEYINILLKGSKEYMDVPHLLSLMTLTLRFFTLNPIMDYKVLGDITKEYERICKEGTISRDKELMKYSHPWMHHILKNRAELFAEKTLKDMYPVKIGYSFHGQGGIMELCKTNSPNTDVNERVKELQKRYK